MQSRTKELESSSSWMYTRPREYLPKKMQNDENNLKFQVKKENSGPFPRNPTPCPEFPLPAPLWHPVPSPTPRTFERSCSNDPEIWPQTMSPTQFERKTGMKILKLRVIVRLVRPPSASFPFLLNQNCDLEANSPRTKPIQFYSLKMHAWTKKLGKSEGQGKRSNSNLRKRD